MGPPKRVIKPYVLDLESTHGTMLNGCVPRYIARRQSRAVPCRPRIDRARLAVALPSSAPLHCRLLSSSHPRAPLRHPPSRLRSVRVAAARYTELRASDVLRFGASTREYVLMHEDQAGGGSGAGATAPTAAKGKGASSRWA